MDWTELLKPETETAFTTTLALLDQVDHGRLDWKPPTGSNWLTTGQLLKHIGDGCGAACRAFLTGDWGLPEGVKIKDFKPEEMLPPAEKLPTTGSVDEVRKLLVEDKTLTIHMIDQAGKEVLANRELAAPWTPGVARVLGWHYLQMIQHLDRHKGQPFYYLKLQGKLVITGDLLA